MDGLEIAIYTLMVVLVTVVVTGIMFDGIWHKRCVAHGVAEYYTEANGTHWRGIEREDTK
jgi:hypothetical protein